MAQHGYVSTAPSSGSSTVVTTPRPEEQERRAVTLHLQAAEPEREERSRSARGVRWNEEVVDNEHMNKKKSKGE